MTPSRKRLLRFLAASAGLGVAALGGVVWHYTRPAVQRDLALGALRENGFSGDIAGVSAGLGGGFMLEGVDLTDSEGRKFRIGRASGDIDVLAAISGDIHVVKLVVDGLNIDLGVSGKKAAGSPADSSSSSHSAGSSGTSSAATSPVTAPGAEPKKTFGALPPVRVDAADITGSLALAGAAPRDFSLRFRNVDTRKGAALVFKAKDVSGAVVSGDALLKFGATPSGKFASAFELWRALKPELSLDADAGPSSANSTAARIRLTAGASEIAVTAKSGTGSVSLKASPSATGTLAATGDWRIDSDTLKVWMKEPPSGLSTRGTLALGFDPSTGIADIKASGTGTAKALIAGNVGSRDFAFDVSAVGSQETSWRIRSVHAAIGAPGAEKALAVDAAEVTWFPGDRHIETRSDEAASVKLRGLPLAWFNPLLKPGVKFGAGEITGDLRLSRGTNGAVAIDSGAGLVASGVALTREGATWLEGLSLKLPVRADVTPEGAVSASIRRLELKRLDAVVAEADATWKSLPTGAGTLDAAATFAPGALPAGFLPGGACEFCKDAGLTLAAVSKVSLSAAGEIRVESAKVDAVTREGVRALAVNLLKPAGVASTPPEGDLASISFKGAPLALANPLMKGPVLSGIAETGDFTLARTASGWRVARPAKGAVAFVRGLAWTDATGTVWLKPTDARGTIAWESTATGWKLKLDDTVFTNASGAALAGDVDLAWTDVFSGLTADLKGDLPALAKSLPAAEALPVSRGTFSLKALHPAAGESTADLRLDDLRPYDGGPAFAVALSAKTSETKGVRKFSVPVTLTGPSGVTKIAATGTTAEAGATRDWQVAVKGDTLYVDDWALLAASGSKTAPVVAPEPGKPGPAVPAKPPVSPAATPAAVAEKPDTKPFWSGHTGRLSLAFDSIRAGGENVVNPAMALKVEATRLSTETFAATWRDLPATGRAQLDFTAGSPRPYSLVAEGGMDTVPVGRLIFAFAPKASGWLEGDFNAKFGATGSAPTAGSLASNLTVTANLESNKGTLKFFQMDNAAVRISGEIVGIAGELAGDLGKIIGDKKPGVAKALNGASLIQKAMSTMNYDKFTVSAKRMPDGSLEVPGIEVYNSEVRFHATGKLGPAGGKDFESRAASLVAGLYGRDTIADALAGLGRTSGRKDASGWVAGPEMRYEGPLGDLRNNLINNLFKSLSLPTPPVPGVIRRPVEGAKDSVDRVLERIGF